MAVNFAPAVSADGKGISVCAEIVTQVLHVKEEALKHQRPLSNIVFMGTGEPLDNFVNLMKAIRIINSNKGINIGARHITISTVGVVPKIKELAAGRLAGGIGDFFAWV